MINLLTFLAQTSPHNCERGPGENTKCLTNFPTVSANQGQLQNGLTIFFGVIAAVAIITIMIAAFNFVTGGDDPDKISRSKKTIVYSLIGLAIALMAEAIVLMVVGKL